MSDARFPDRTKLILFAALVGLGLLGNYFYLPLFFGVDFLFGTIASGLAIGLLGSGWGVAAAALIGAATFVNWGHPWAMIITIAEAFVIGSLVKRTRGSLVLGASIYWAVIGMTLVWLFYRGIMKMDVDGTWLVALKQSFNGIVNALVASLILAYTPLRNRSWLPREKLNSLFQTIFLLAATIALVPAVIVLTLNSQGIAEKIEEDLQHRLDTVASAFSTEINRWQQEHLHAVQKLADIAKETGVRPSASLQRSTQLIKESKRDFLNLLVADANATSVAFFPSKNKNGESTIGLNFSDRAYFKKTKETLRPVISEVLQGRGGTFDPIVLVTAPIVSEGRFLGYAGAALDLDRVSKMLDFKGFELTLVDSSGLVIATNRNDIRPLERYPEVTEGRELIRQNGYYRNMPKSASNSMAKWNNTKIGKESVTDSSHQWRLIIETPLAPQQQGRYHQHIQSITILLSLIAAVLALSYFLAARVAAPLTQLARMTTNLPTGLPSSSIDNDSMVWPTSSITEVNFLVANFQRMTQALQKRFEELHHEIAEREKAEGELRRTSRLKDEFLATLSHELRTPLNVIMGFVELIQVEGINEESPEHFAVISRNASHLNSLIQDLLDVSRIITGKFALEKAPVHVPTVIEHAMESVRLAADAKRIRLLTNINGNEITVAGDASRLQQVLWNLLSNSIKFTPMGGEVEVSSHRAQHTVEIRVRDTGEGIKAEFLPDVFQRFRQEDGSFSRNHGGLGLGLSIVRQIVELHGGSVRAESAGKGMGTTMVVVLPAIERAESVSSLDTQHP